VGEVVGEFDYLGWRLDGGSFVMDLAPEKGTTTSNCGKPSLGSRSLSGHPNVPATVPLMYLCVSPQGLNGFG
jgi:hypothetical protein